jgi:transcriptional regulator with XRE-family HTH domain
MSCTEAPRQWLAKAGAQLRVTRVEHGLSQLELARILGVSKGAVSLWESGSRRPDAEYIYRLEGELGLPVETWLRGAA